MRTVVAVAAVVIALFAVLIVLGRPSGVLEDFWEEGGKEEYLPELGEGPVVFTVCPLEENAILAVEPLGNLNPSGGHVFPSDHGGFYFVDAETDPPPYEVRSPADGIITEIYWRVREWPEWTGRWGHYNDYKITIAHTNTFRSVIDHVMELDNWIVERAGELKPDEFNRVKIPVKAGDRIGKTGGRLGIVAGIDWGVVDENVTLSYIRPERYGDSAHAVHFIPYCEENLKVWLLEKLYDPFTGKRREAEPLWGKADFDIPGRLSGNWFLEGTEEWNPAYHLAFVYDMWDPTQIRIAVAGDWGESISTLDIPATVYSVEGNAPDPASISVENGAVIYWLRGAEAGEEHIMATLLVQMLDNERIKVEAFNGHVENPQFTQNAKYYTR